MIAPSEQLGGKPDDDKINPLFEIMAIKKETDAMREKLESIDKCVGRLAWWITSDDEKPHF